jgi:hypothetical protein
MLPSRLVLAARRRRRADPTQPNPNQTHPHLTYTHTHTPTHTLNSVAHQRAPTGCARHQQPKCQLCYHARPGLVAGERTRDLKREVRR